MVATLPQVYGAEIVQGEGLPVPASAQFLRQREGTSVIADGLLVAALQTADDAEVVQRLASPDAVADLLVQARLHGFPQESGGLLVPTLLTVDIAQVVQRDRSLAADVAGAPEQHQGPMEEDRCLLVITQAEVNAAEGVQGSRFGGSVTCGPRGGAGVAVDGDGRSG